MTIQIPLTAILLVLIASGVGTLARWVVQRLGGPDWLAFWMGLFFFGLILVFGKVT